MKRPSYMTQWQWNAYCYRVRRAWANALLECCDDDWCPLTLQR